MSIMLAMSGCATSGHVPSRQGALAADVDPSIAFTPLEDIQPPVEPPASPDEQKPVTKRAAEQIHKAETLVGQQRYTEASLALERALRFLPNHPLIHRALATLHWEAGNVERARNHSVRAIEGNPDDARAHFILGRCWRRMKHPDKALASLRTALLCSDFGLNTETAALTHFHLGELLAAQGYLEAALLQFAAFEKSSAKVPQQAGNANLTAVLAQHRETTCEIKSVLLEKLGRFDEAASALAPIATKPGVTNSLALRHANLLMRAGRMDAALSAARKIESDDPAVIDLLREIHGQMGHPDRIVDDLRHRVAERPDDPTCVLHLARALSGLNRASEARNALAIFSSSHEVDDVFRAKMVEVMIVQSMWGDAIETCAEGIRKDPLGRTICEQTLLDTVKNTNDRELAVALETKTADEDYASTYLRGRLAGATGHVEQALAMFKDVIAHDHSFVPARVALGRIYLGKYQYEQALAAVARSAEDQPEHFQLELILGELYERLDDQEKAQLHFRAAIQLNRSHTRAMYLLAKLYGETKRLASAQRQLRVLLEQDPTNDSARELLSSIYLSDGKPDVAIVECEELKRISTSARAHARCESLLELARGNDPQKTRQALKEAMELEGPDVDTWNAIARTYRRFHQADKRRDAYLAALTINPSRDDVTFKLVEEERRLLHFESAAQRLEQLLRLRPNRHAWHRELIDLYLVIQDEAKALSHAIAGEASAGNDDRVQWQYRIRVLDALRLAGRKDEIVKRLKKWVGADKPSKAWSIVLGTEYLRQEQPKLAVEVFERLHQNDANDRAARRRLINALSAAGSHDRATQYILETLENDPENDAAIEPLIRVLVGAKRSDDALELIRNKLLHTLNRQAFQNLQIDVLRDADRFEESIELIEGLLSEVITILQDGPQPDRGEDAVERTRDAKTMRLPDEPFTQEKLQSRLLVLNTLLAQHLILSKQYPEAEDRLTEWLESERNPELRYRYLLLLTSCYQSQRKDDKAAPILERALMLQPDREGLNNDVAYGWIDRGVKLVEAERMIRFALASQPRQSAYLDTYGWLMYKTSRFDEATKWLTRSVRARHDEDPVVFDHLGDAAWRLGEKEQAVNYWKSAMVAVANRDQERINSDESRVKETAQQKIDDVEAGRTPNVADLEAPPEDSTE